MKKFVIDKKVFEVLPEYCIGLVVAEGIDNHINLSDIDTLLDNNTKTFHIEKQDINIRDIRGVAAFRAAFQSLGMNPNKFSCSIEALLKRVQKSGQLPHINPIVDLGNALSVAYALPMGAHDIDKLESSLAVRFSVAEDHFHPLGEDNIEAMPEGELVYVSDHTVKTRRWVWRQSDDGKITEETSHVVFPIDGFMGINDQDVKDARDELAQKLEAFFGCRVKTGFVCRDVQSFDLTD